MLRRSPPRRLLIVEDDVDLQRQLCWTLDGYELLQVSNRDDALTALRAHEPAVALLDLGLPPEPQGVGEGFAVLEAILGLLPATRVIILTGQEDRAHGARAVTRGAHDYCTKPVRPELLATLIERAFNLAELETLGRRGAEADPSPVLPGVIGSSPEMRRVARMVERVAAAPVDVVLVGESGTGKKLIARAIHALSPRRTEPMSMIDCRAMPDGLLAAELFGSERGGADPLRWSPGRIEAADRGTLLLDGIGDLPPALQARLLSFLTGRVLQRGGGGSATPTDVRILAATERDPDQLTASRRMRADLHHALGEVTVPIPPLRKRADDAVLLARHFLDQNGRQLKRARLGLTDDAVVAIARHRWPGNVRELRNRIQRALLLAEGRRVTAFDLGLEEPDHSAEPINLRAAREGAERSAVRRAIAETGGNVSRAARLLGISRPTLYQLLRQHQLRS